MGCSCSAQVRACAGNRLRGKAIVKCATDAAGRWRNRGAPGVRVDACREKGRRRIAGPSWRGRVGSREAPPRSRGRSLEAEFAVEGDGVAVEVPAGDVGVAAVEVQAQGRAAAAVVAGGHADVRVERAAVDEDEAGVSAKGEADAGAAGAVDEDVAGVARTDV